MLYCPSMMCSNFERLKEEVQNLDEAGADIFHIDIMDGNFVPNFGMGIQDISVIRKATNKLVDVHLMISNPSQYISLFVDLGVDIIYVHIESDPQISRILDKIRTMGKKAGIVINPGTSYYQIEEILPIVDYVMVMTVNPGFSGQSYLEFVDEKIKKIVSKKSEYKYQVLIDGAVSPSVISRLSSYGVDGFVLGTSTLFNKKESYKEIFKRLL